MRFSKLCAGARFVAGNDITAGDVVFFTEFPDNTFVARALTREQLPSVDGPMYVAVSFDSQGDLTFREVSRDEID